MANTRSDLMANVLADPVVINDPNISHGRLRVKTCRVTSPATPGAGQIFVLMRLKAHDHLHHVWLSSVGGDAQLDDMNLGIFEAGDWTVADQSVPTGASADGLADGINFTSAGQGIRVDILGSPDGTIAESLMNQPLWAMASVTTEPPRGTEYDLCLTAVSDPAGETNTFVISVEYTSGD